MGSLDGLKVLDLSRLLPAPFCTALLADHGAEVTALEGPRFRDDQVIGNVPMTRRNKRHISVDLITLKKYGICIILSSVPLRRKKLGSKNF